MWSHFLRRTGSHFAGKCSSLPCGRCRTCSTAPRNHVQTSFQPPARAKPGTARAIFHLRRLAHVCGGENVTRHAPLRSPLHLSPVGRGEGRAASEATATPLRRRIPPARSVRSYAAFFTPSAALSMIAATACGSEHVDRVADFDLNDPTGIANEQRRCAAGIHSSLHRRLHLRTISRGRTESQDRLPYRTSRVTRGRRARPGVPALRARCGDALVTQHASVTH
jgi:hypothetical protein